MRFVLIRYRSPPASPAWTEGSAEHSMSRSRPAGVSEVLAIADVAVAELDTAASQSGQRQFAAPPLQIVKRDNPAVRHVSLKRQGEMRADKARAAGDHYSHLIHCYGGSHAGAHYRTAPEWMPPLLPPIRGWRFLVAQDGDGRYATQTYHIFYRSAKGCKSLIQRAGSPGLQKFR